MKLRREYIEKPWGRTLLPTMFEPPAGKRIGEVWFTSTHDLPLLAKYIFTSERLSIQVHPSDEQASARGQRSGKAECCTVDKDSLFALGNILNQAAIEWSAICNRTGQRLENEHAWMLIGTTAWIAPGRSNQTAPHPSRVPAAGYRVPRSGAANNR